VHGCALAAGTVVGGTVVVVAGTVVDGVVVDDVVVLGWVVVVACVVGGAFVVGGSVGMVVIDGPVCDRGAVVGLMAFTVDGGAAVGFPPPQAPRVTTARNVAPMTVPVDTRIRLTLVICPSAA